MKEKKADQSCTYLCHSINLNTHIYQHNASNTLDVSFFVCVSVEKKVAVFIGRLLNSIKCVELLLYLVLCSR